MKKLEIIAELLERGPVMVHCDGRSCEVPTRLQTPHLALRFGWQLQPPIYDLTVARDALSGTLAFSGVPFPCRVPWEAVFAAGVEGEDHLISWPKDFPSATAARPPVTPRLEVVPSLDEAPVERPRSHLRLVRDDE